MTISAVDRLRLEGMLGMLGSNHVGERDNAAKLITQFLSDRGLTWGDVLTRSPTGGFGLGMAAYRPGQSFDGAPSHHAPFRGAPPFQGAPFQGVPLRAGRTRRLAPAGDSAWRWGMLSGLMLVGAVSLMTLLRQTAIEQRIIASAAVVGRCPAGSEDGTWPLCGTPTAAGKAVTSPAAQADSALAGGNRKPGASFAQGVADRKVADSWHKLAPPGLCGRPFGSGQEDYRAACRMAEKLLAQFEQRRRSDPEYRRGWNSTLP
jgi:hypothetical protein